jgi:hypothetical protein
MNLRSTAIHTLAATAGLAWISLNAHAQVKRTAKRTAPANSASHVPAEMAKGTLNPSETRPGDEVALRLTDDLKSNGDIVLKKGATITGVVRNVKSLEKKGQGQALSMMEIEWFAPAAQGKAPRQFSIALQSVTQLNRVLEERQSKGAEQTRFSGGVPNPAFATVAARPAAQTNAALLNMPSVVAVDTKTASSLDSSFGTSSSQQLFRVGRGEWITAGGSKQSVELFSHLSNDTVITSPSKDFEISTGAQMQLLVGVSKQ